MLLNNNMKFDKLIESILNETVEPFDVNGKNECPKCGSDLILKHNKVYCTGWCKDEGAIGEIKRDKKGSTYINYFDRDDWPDDLGKLDGTTDSNPKGLNPDPKNPFGI